MSRNNCPRYPYVKTTPRGKSISITACTMQDARDVEPTCSVESNVPIKTVLQKTEDVPRWACHERLQPTASPVRRLTGPPPNCLTVQPSDRLTARPSHRPTPLPAPVKSQPMVQKNQNHKIQWTETGGPTKCWGVQPSRALRRVPATATLISIGWIRILARFFHEHRSVAGLCLYFQI